MTLWKVHDHGKVSWVWDMEDKCEALGHWYSYERLGLYYQARHGLYASLLSPERYSSRGHRFDIGRLTRFLEVFAYFSPAHAYSLHVSFLGLFPILMSTNEPLKREAIARLEGIAIKEGKVTLTTRPKE